VVIAVGGALVFVFASGANKQSGPPHITGRKPAPASLVKTVATIPQSTWAKVGAGSVSSLPTKLPGPPLVTNDGKPRIVYMGSEYCPYCATERWGLVNALSRFGDFTNLQITSSALRAPSGDPEAFPNTQTFSFHGSSYKSDYVQFEPVEQQDNSYKDLDQPTAEQSGLIAKYDAPPYTDSGGAIPFVDFANQYMISGASYDAGVLKDKTQDQIAKAMADGTSDISKGALGSANVITATICATTNNKPADVCNDPIIQAIQSQITSQSVPK
jgi:hypothetical protein